MDNAIPSGTGKGDFTMNPASGTATLDLNGHAQTLNGIAGNGAGSSVVDNTAASTSVTLTVGDNNGTGTFAGRLTNSATGSSLGLTKVGNGLISLTGTNGYKGATTVGAGTLQGGVANAVPASSALVVNGGTFALAGGNDTVASLSGSGGTVNVTTNLLTVTGTAGQTNTYAGSITGNFPASAGTMTNGGFGLLVNNGVQIINGNLTLSADANTYAGGNRAYLRPQNSAEIDLAGTTLLTNVQVYPTGSSTVRFNGGTHLFIAGVNGNFALSANAQCIVDGGASVTSDYMSIGFGGSGNAALTVNSGSLNYNGSSSLFIGNGVGAGSVSTLNLNGGSLTTAAFANSGSGTNFINFNGGKLICGGASVLPSGTNTAGNLLNLLVGNGGAVIDTAGYNNSLALALQNNGSGGLTKLGAGTLTLSTNNTYVGPTVVSNGVLLVNGSLASASAVTVATNAMLGGSGTIGGNVTFNLGASATNRQGSPLTVTGSLTLNNNTVYVSTPSVLAAGSYTLMAYNATGSSGTFNSTPVVSGAGIAANTTATIVTGGGLVQLQVTANQPTTLTLISSVNPSTYGQMVTFTASVQTNGVTAANATSNVVFSVDGTAVATNSLSGGQAFYTTSLFTVPSHTLTSTYSGDVRYLPSTNSLTQTVNPETTTVALNGNAFTYNGAARTPSISISGSSGSRSTNYTGISYSSANAPTNAGNYTLTVSVLGEANYFGATNSLAFTIYQASISVGANSTNNPCGFKDAVAFLATLPTDATGSVVFSSTNGAFSTNLLTGGSATSLSITNLPRGTNVITVAYLGDGNYLGSSTNIEQIVTNHPPVLAPLNLTRTAGLGLHFFWSQLTNQWSDVDGDSIALTTFNLSTSNSVSLFTNATLIGYPSSAPNVADQINYTASDSYGVTVAGVINIAVNAYVTGTNSIVKITAGNPTMLKAYGVIGFSYITERSTNLNDWVSVATNTVSTNGVISVSDSFSDLGGNSPSSAYYRIKWQP